MSKNHVAIELINPVVLDEGTDDEVTLPIGIKGVLKPDYTVDQDMFAHFNDPEAGYIYLKESEYKELPDSELPLESRAMNAFGENRFHSLYSLKEPFKENTRCYCCTNTATKRIVFNTWGTVCEYDMCDEHAEAYGDHCGDGVTPYEETETA